MYTYFGLRASLCYNHVYINNICSEALFICSRLIWCLFLINKFFPILCVCFLYDKYRVFVKWKLFLSDTK